MPISNVALTDTFDEWRNKTNQLIVQGDQILINIGDLYPRTNSIMFNANNSYNVANFSAVQANTARLHANVAFEQANTARTHANTAHEQANTARNHANTAFNVANISFVQANTGLTQANTARDHANAAHVQANTARIHANVSFEQANTARIHANIAFNQANTARDTANSALPNTTSTFNGTLTLTGNLNSRRVIVSFAQESANTPSYSFAGAPYSGIYTTGANSFALATSSNARMEITSTGRITGNGSFGSTGFNGHGDRYVSTSAPSGGLDGDIWYKV